MSNWSTVAEALGEGGRAELAVVAKTGRERRCPAEEGCYMLVLSVALRTAWPDPRLWGVWGGLPGLPEPKVLCCSSCFRLTHLLNFPVFLPTRTKEQGQVAGQAATLSHEVRRDLECHQSRRYMGRKSSNGAWGGAFPSRCSLYFLLPFAFLATSAPGLALLPPSRYSLGLLLLLFQHNDLGWEQKLSVNCALSIGVRVQECPAGSRAVETGWPSLAPSLQHKGQWEITQLWQMASGTKHALL